MTCPNCNYLNSEGTLFCKQCNSFIPDAVIANPDAVFAALENNSEPSEAAPDLTDAATPPTKDTAELPPPYFLDGHELAAIYAMTPQDLPDTSTSAASSPAPERLATPAEAGPSSSEPEITADKPETALPSIDIPERVAPTATLEMAAPYFDIPERVAPTATPLEPIASAPAVPFVEMVSKPSTADLPPLVVKAIKISAEPVFKPSKPTTGSLIKAIKAPTGPLSDAKQPAAAADQRPTLMSPPAPTPVTPLAPPPPMPPPPGVAGDDTTPFEDFLPVWNNADQPKPGPARQSRLLKPVRVERVSVDNLLDETTKQKASEGTGSLSQTAGAGPQMSATAIAPAIPAPPPLPARPVAPAPVLPAQPQSVASTWPAPGVQAPPPPPAAAPADPMEGLPVPSYQMPPLWYKPPKEIGWTEVKNPEPPRDLPSARAGNAVRANTLERLGLSFDAADAGVEKGIYYYSDFNGDIRVFALAGFFRRLAGAFVDLLVTAVIGVIVVFVVAIAFSNLPFTRNNFILYVLVLEGLTFFFTFWYHAFLVGLTGQTVGHRVFKIKVMRQGGRGVGLLSGVVRAFYGLIPTIGSIIIALLLPSTDTQSNSLANNLSLGLLALTAFGMGWAFFSKKKQGWHDKLAATYVVGVNEIKVPE